MTSIGTPKVLDLESGAEIPSIDFHFDILFFLAIGHMEEQRMELFLFLLDGSIFPNGGILRSRRYSKKPD